MKSPTAKFYENPPSWSRIDTCGQIDRRMDMKKLTDAFREYEEDRKMTKV